MTSIPQLKADINKLQSELATAHARIAELEDRPEVIRELKVPIETVRIEYRDREPVVVTVYVDNPEHIATIERLQAIIRGRA